MAIEVLSSKGDWVPYGCLTGADVDLIDSWYDTVTDEDHDWDSDVWPAGIYELRKHDLKMVPK